MNQYPRYKVAAAHIAPVFGDVAATLDKACDFIDEAARAGVRLIAFPEVFIPGYPTWVRLVAPIDSHRFFTNVVSTAIMADGPEMRRLQNIARLKDIYISIGFNEATPRSVGCVWNSNVLIGADGSILNHHRKLVPTFAEKLVWANGDGYGLRVSDTELGKIGMLICGENTNPLARYSLMAQGEQVHISSYPCVCADRRADGSKGYDLQEGIRIRAAAHSFEAKAFNIVSSTAYDPSLKKALAPLGSEIISMLDTAPKSVSMVLGPTGQVISDVYCEDEGLCVAEVDTSRAIEPKRVHDVVGYYNRFDVFDLVVRRHRDNPIRFLDGEQAATRRADAPQSPAQVSTDPSVDSATCGSGSHASPESQPLNAQKQ